MIGKTFIQVSSYSFNQRCFSDSEKEVYQINYLLDLLSQTHDWQEVIRETYTAQDVLLSIINHFNPDAVETVVDESSYKVIYEGLTNIVKIEEEYGLDFSVLLPMEPLETKILPNNRVLRRKNKKRTAMR